MSQPSAAVSRSPPSASALRRLKRDGEGKTYKDASGFTAKDTEWHRITCFNGLARNVAQYAGKGMLASVSGRIRNSKWTDSDGIERYSYEIIAEEVQFLNRPAKPEEPEQPSRTDEA